MYFSPLSFNLCLKEFAKNAECHLRLFYFVLVSVSCPVKNFKMLKNSFQVSKNFDLIFHSTIIIPFMQNKCR